MAEIGRRIAMGAVSLVMAAGTLAGPTSAANATPAPSAGVTVAAQDGDRDWDRWGWRCHRYHLHRYDRYNPVINRWCHRTWGWDRWDRWDRDWDRGRFGRD